MTIKNIAIRIIEMMLTRLLFLNNVGKKKTKTTIIKLITNNIAPIK